MSAVRAVLVAITVSLVGPHLASAQTSPEMTFFITSVNPARVPIWVASKERTRIARSSPRRSG
jgi:hypothetical protein